MLFALIRSGNDHAFCVAINNAIICRFLVQSPQEWVIQCVDENKLLVLLSGHSYIQFDRICMIRIAFCCRNRMSIWIALPISQSSSINIQNSLLLYGNIDNAVLFIFIRRLSNSVIYPGQFEFFHCGMPGICESHTPNRRTVSYYFNK